MVYVYELNEEEGGLKVDKREWSVGGTKEI